MTPMLDLLAKNPGQAAEIRDDRDATRLLLEVGIIDKFMKNPHPGRQWFSMACTACDTHYIIGVVFSDFPDTVDNGYIAHCLPVSHFTGRQWAISNYGSICNRRASSRRSRPSRHAGGE